MEELLIQINKKLNVLIGLLLEIHNSSEEKPKAEKDIIKKLSDLGMTNKDIGLLLSKNANQISKQLYKAKRKRGK